jgi:cell division protein FtsB
MVTRTRLRATLQTLALYIGAALFIGYFAHNAYTGDRGLRAREDLLQQEAELTDELTRLKTERQEWERRVSLLRSNSIDPDMLDERARAMLDYVHPRDLIFTENGRIRR